MHPGALAAGTLPQYSTITTVMCDISVVKLRKDRKNLSIISLKLNSNYHQSSSGVLYRAEVSFWRISKHLYCTYKGSHTGGLYPSYLLLWKYDSSSCGCKVYTVLAVISVSLKTNFFTFRQLLHFGPYNAHSSLHGLGRHNITSLTLPNRHISD